MPKFLRRTALLGVAEARDERAGLGGRRDRPGRQDGRSEVCGDGGQKEERGSCPGVPSSSSIYDFPNRKFQQTL